MTCFKEIEAGKLLMLDSGEYSDYGVDGFFVVLKPFKPHVEFIEHHNENKGVLHTRYDFIAHLCKKGYIMDIDYEVIYQGTFGDLTKGDFRGLLFKDALDVVKE